MGHVATWIPAEGGQSKTGTVLLKSPTEANAYLGSQAYNLPEFDAYSWMMEYRKGVFTGLKESVDGRGTEYVTVNGQEFFVNKVDAIFDGRTYVARLQVHQP
jgi:hypothetical protein